MTELLNSLTQELNQESPWLLPLAFALFGACIGSFLNVVIYRLPLGLSVNKPRRSFCPFCRKAIPWRLNIPLVSWLALRGRSACCHKRISVRYWLVECFTALLFAAISWRFSQENALAQALICAWAALMLATLAIDWENMIVIPKLLWGATLIGVLAATLSPWLLAPESLEGIEGALWSLGGACSGYLLFRMVAFAGRLLFGSKRTVFEQPQEWSMRQTDDGKDIVLSLNRQDFLWSEIFLEEDNRLIMSGAMLVQKAMPPGTLEFAADSVTLPNGERVLLENFERLSGSCEAVTTRREAMGSGDALIAMAIGSLCGWQGVLFSLVAGSFVGLVWAVAARIGRGKPMPFGPSLIFGAIVWIFYGVPLWIAYVNWAGLDMY